MYPYINIIYYILVNNVNDINIGTERLDYSGISRYIAVYRGNMSDIAILDILTNISYHHAYVAVLES